MARLITRVLVSLFLVIAAGGGVARLASAQEPGALVNGVSTCPPNLDGASIDPAACAEPAAGVGFSVANPNTDNVAFGDTGGDGLVSFPLDQFAISPDGAEVEVGVIAGSDPYGAITGYVASCTRNGEALDVSYVSGEVQPGGATLGIRFTAFPGDQVACEWYLSHAADDGGNDGGNEDSGDDSTGGEQAIGGTVTELPTTGAGPAHRGERDAALLAGAALVALAGGIASLAVTRRSGSVDR